MITKTQKRKEFSKTRLSIFYCTCISFKNSNTNLLSYNYYRKFSKFCLLSVFVVVVKYILNCFTSNYSNVQRTVRNYNFDEAYHIIFLVLATIRELYRVFIKIIGDWTVLQIISDDLS